MLAHAEHNVAGVGFWSRARGTDPVTFRNRGFEQVAHGGTGGGVGGIAERAGDGHDRPCTAEIGECNEQRDLGLVTAQDRHRFGLRRGGGHLSVELAAEALHVGFGRRRQDAGEADGIAED